MKVFDIFKPAPYLEEIPDKETVKKEYRYWRWRTFYSMYIGYVFYYFTRKSFTFAMPILHKEMGMSLVELGLLGSIFSLTYGASKFLSGILCDKSNTRYFMSIGLILTGISNLVFGVSSFWWTFAILWGINGLFQGWGPTGCAKLLSHWYSQSERGRWWSIWSTSHNLGGALIPIIVATVAEQYGWRFAMYFPGILCIMIGFFLINRLRDTPQSLGLPAIEIHRNDHPSKKIDRNEKTSFSAKEILFEYVLNNKYLWVLAFVYFFVYVIRTAINDWSMLYFVEVKGYSSIVSGVIIFCFEMGGFLGSLVAGWSSDTLFKGKRNPVSAIFTFGILLPLYLFQNYVQPAPILDAIFLFLFGFFVFGPQLLVGMAAAELSHKKAAASANGFVGCFGYMGAAFAGGPLGVLMKQWGWDGYLLSIFGCTVIGTLLLLPLWSVRTSPKVAEEEPSRAT